MVTTGKPKRPATCMQTPRWQGSYSPSRHFMSEISTSSRIRQGPPGMPPVLLYFLEQHTDTVLERQREEKP